ncbi:Malate synthase [Sesbania bispinosa]|nr:Malate synthase [Sesbania bispinosa]
MGNDPNQIGTMKRDDVANITEEDLLQIPRGARTMEGLRLNTRVGIQYVATWLTRTGSVPLYNLMEDVATAEISRVQNWQWLKYGVELDGDGLGVKVNRELFGRVVEEEMARIENEAGKEKFKKGMYKAACKIFTRQSLRLEVIQQAAHIPIRDDPVTNKAKLELVRKDKLREVKAGYMMEVGLHTLV